jgi:two-component system, OmpR family, response regulator
MGRPLILVVEDEWVLRNCVVRALMADGWHVLDAGSGEAALGLIYASLRPINALFTAVQLNGILTGWDVANAVRQRNSSASIVYAGGESNDRHRGVPGSVFLEKPYVASAVVTACAKPGPI